MNAVSSIKREGDGYAIGGGSGDISQGQGLGIGCGECGECKGCEHCGRPSCSNGGGSTC